MFAEGLDGGRTGLCFRSLSGCVRDGAGQGLAGWRCSVHVVNGIGHGVGFNAWGCSARWL